MDKQLFEEVDKYISRLLANEDQVLKDVITSLDQAGLPQFSVSPSQGKLLQVFAAMCGAKNILELGTLGGYSTIWLARTLPAAGKLITIEFDDRCADVAEKNLAAANLQSKVSVRRGKALDVLPLLQNENAGPFDLIFIDADKPPYTEYFQWALKLSRPGSIIICDNVIREGKVMEENHTDEKVRGVQRFNEFLSKCKEVHSIILPTVGMKEFDGMAVSVVI